MLLTQDATARLALGALILYLASHGLTGQQGLIAYVDLQARERALEAAQADLDTKISDLEDRAARLRTDSPAFDRDYLEERARALLNAARTDEVVIDLGDGAGAAAGVQTAGLP